MNWTDVAVIVIIGGFAVLGFVTGFLLSVFRIVSFFVAAFLAVKLYPVISNVLEKTPLYSTLKSAILKNLESPKAADAGSKTVHGVIENLNVPGFLKPVLEKEVMKQVTSPAKILDVVSTELTKVALAVISVIVLYIVIRIGMLFLKFLLKSIAELPVFKQVDKLGGIGFGALEGLFFVYIVFAIMMLFNSSPSFKGFFTAVDASLLAKVFYQHNIIIDWMF